MQSRALGHSSPPRVSPLPCRAPPPCPTDPTPEARAWACLPQDQGLPGPQLRGQRALGTFPLLGGLAGRRGRGPGAPALPGQAALAAVVALLVQVQLHADPGLHLQAGLLPRLLTVAPGQALVRPAGWDVVGRGVR